MGHHERSGAAIFLTPGGVKRGTRIARLMEHERLDRVFSATCVGVPWQLRPDQRNLVRPVAPEAEAKQGVAHDRDACSSESSSEKIRHEKSL